MRINKDLQYDESGIAKCPQGQQEGQKGHLRILTKSASFGSAFQTLGNALKLYFFALYRPYTFVLTKTMHCIVWLGSTFKGAQ